MSFKLFLIYQTMVAFWTHADKSSSTLILTLDLSILFGTETNISDIFYLLWKMLESRSNIRVFKLSYVWS